MTNTTSDPGSDTEVPTGVGAAEHETVLGEGTIKETMLRAGLEILERDGLALGADTIGYARVFRHLEDNYSIRVTRGSVHERIWANHDDYRRDVMAETLKTFPHHFLKGGNPNLKEILEDPANDDVDRRLAVFSHGAGATVNEAALNSAELARAQAVIASASRLNGPSGSERFRSLFKLREEEALDDRRRRFPWLLHGLEVRPRQEFGLSVDDTSDLFYSMLHSLFRGVHLNYNAGCQAMAEPVRFMPEVTDEPWCMPAVAMKCFLGFLCEIGDSGVKPQGPPPDIRPPVDGNAGLSNRLDATQPDRRTRQELEELVVAGGVEVLLANALVLKSDSLRYSAVLAHIEETRGFIVHRSSVHGRIWASQEEYQMEVLARSVPGEIVPVPPINDVLEGAAPRGVHRADGTLDIRQTSRDLILEIANYQADELVDNLDHHRELLVKALLASRGNSVNTAPVLEAIAAGDRVRIDRYKRFIQEHILDLGFVVRPESGVTAEEALVIISHVASALIAGAFFAQMAGAEPVTTRYPIPRVDGSGKIEQWPPCGIAVMALIEQLFEVES